MALPLTWCGPPPLLLLPVVSVVKTLRRRSPPGCIIIRRCTGPGSLNIQCHMLLLPAVAGVRRCAASGCSVSTVARGWRRRQVACTGLCRPALGFTCFSPIAVRTGVCMQAGATGRPVVRVLPEQMTGALQDAYFGRL